MKIFKIFAVLVAAFSITACGPADVHTDANPKYRDILPNETAFVIPLEGKALEGQGKFGSAEFLKSKKVATKRIHIPRTKLSTGRMPWSFKYIPSVKIITVNRAPIVMEWENEHNCISVESRDSIGFCIGITVGAEVLEEDTAQFLYSFPSGSLSQTLNAAVKTQATEKLSNKFATYDLEGSPTVLNKAGKTVTKAVPGARQQKGVVVAETKEELYNYFKAKGVTLTSFGLVGGLSYEDSEIQVAINNNFKSELRIKDATNKKLEQAEVNAKEFSIAVNAKNEALEFAQAKNSRTAQVELEIRRMNAQANINRSERWDGKLPADMMMLPASSDPGFILDMSKK